MVNILTKIYRHTQTQPSSTEHSQIMQTAALEDQNLLEVQLCGLDSASDSASDEMLKEIRERTTPVCEFYQVSMFS